MNAPSTLTPKDRQSLVQEGFLLLRGVADAQTVQAMRETWTRCMQQPVELKRGNNDGPCHLENEAAFRPCLEHPVAMGAVAQLLDGDVVLLGMRGRNPRPGGGQQGFHVDDAAPVPPERQCIVNAFWMLDDMDESNGATRLIPGTHRLRRVPDKSLSQPDARHPQARHIAARAGDVLVFSAHLWHAGSKNISGASRRIAMAHFARREIADLRANAMEMEGA
jgi:hypothetical protein